MTVLFMKIKARSEGYSNLFIHVYLIASFGFLAAFFIFPIALSIYYSFTNLSLYNIYQFSFVGLRNYISLFTSRSFLNSFYITMLFLFLSAIVGQAMLGLVLAYMLNTVRSYFRTVVTTSLLLAWATPQVTAGILWYTTLSIQPPGVVNLILSSFGLHAVNFLGIRYAIFSIIVANIWLGLAFSVLIYMAGIQNINPSTIKSSIVDGAGPVSRFIHIVVPQLKNSILMDVILITLFTLGTFTMVFTLTGGGPAETTNLLTIYQYYTAFSFFDIGLGSAIGTIVICVAIVLSFLYIRIMRVGV